MTYQIQLLVVWVVGVWGEGVPPHPHQAPTLPAHLDPASCPHSYHQHPLVLVSMDGFRADYLHRGLTPTLDALGQAGVTAPYMKPSFPTITFPNHYTIVTGLYPPAHGVVANKFYDPALESEFRIGRPESFKSRWWGGEALWTTLQKQGKRSATFFWPGSEVSERHPTYWYYYNESVPFPHRVQKVLSWLELPPDTRPDFLTLYMHDPDSTGHDFGPDSPEMDAKLVHVDAVVRELVEGLRGRGLLACVNLLLVADHGMEAAGQDKVIDLSHYLPDLGARARLWDGAFVRFSPHDHSPDTKEEMMRALACKRKEMRVYEKELLPIRWHMGTTKRVEDVVVEVDPGYSVGGDKSFEADEGEHGYDYYFPSMNALFVGYGPDLARGAQVEAFQNIELYNLMCHLLGVTPAPNNGTWGALHHLLARPPPAPPSPPTLTPPAASVPAGESLQTLLSRGACEGDAEESKAWVGVARAAEKRSGDVLRYHLPWGAPQGHTTTTLLMQPDSVTAYSPVVKLPLWTSFTVSRVRSGLGAVGEQQQRWRSDVRLPEGEWPSCLSYASSSVQALNVSRHPLFPPKFSCRSCEELPFVMSNALPFTEQLAGRWEELLTLVGKWSLFHGPLNVVAGPVMDYDSDSFVDDLENLGRSGGLVVPTHVFLVASRCAAHVSALELCPHHQLDTLAFVFPQFIPVTNCLDSARFAQEYSAKVGDVEKITGLTFFPDLAYYDRVRLKVRMHSNIWGRETWPNRLLDNMLGH